MPLKERFDVLVVGARCAGAATAMLMARRGLKVLAIDRGDYGADTLSTHALMRGGVLQLHRWGVLPQLVEVGTPAVRTTNFHYGDAVLALPVKPSQGVEALYAPRRTVLDSILVDAAQSSGAEVRHGHSLTELIRDPAGCVRGAVIVNPDGERSEVGTGLVVGADGAGSTVARLLEIPLLRRARHTSAVIYGHWCGMDAAGYHWHYRPGASAGVIPTNGGRHCVFAAMPSARFRDAGRHVLSAGYLQVLQDVSPDLAAAVARARLESRLWCFAGRPGFMRRPCGPGWALVGDAGYFKDPLTAHGITDALRDAELLAEAAVEQTEAAFRRYSAVRDELSVPLFEITDAIASFDWDLDLIQRHHQALNAAMKREVEYLASLDRASGQLCPSAAMRKQEEPA